jgi:catechol 2,3-dioxygenase-like lactoylglutathione lyase family enzyme
MITGISHIAIVVEDVERSLKFYCDGLGFKKLYGLTGEVEGYRFTTTYLQMAHNQFLELFAGGRVKTEFGLQNIGYSHVCLEVDDLDEMVELMKSKGIPILVTPRVGVDKTRLFWVEDPDGNKIEIMQLTDECLQRTMSQI